jgi:YVTN family beta-propeller protein
VVNATQQFTATVVGTPNTSVTWAVNNTVGGDLTVGTITTTGLYTAPGTLPNPATVTVTATTVSTPNASATAQVTINSGIIVSVSPSTASVGTGETFQFSATVRGTSNTGVTWSVNNVTGGNSSVGTIYTTGLYTAPATTPSPATVTLKAASVADPNQSGAASVTVLAAAAPALAEIHPTTVAEGSALQDVYLKGSNFLSTSVAWVNATPVSSTFISTSLSRARVPSGLLNSSGTLAVDVQAQGGALSGPLSLMAEPRRPALIGATPQSAPQGGAAFRLNLNGGYYSPSVTAEFDGRVQAATLTSSRQLNVAIGASDLTTAGLFSVAVRNAAAAQPLATVNLAVQPSVFPSAPMTTVPVGLQPSAVAINTATGVAVVANRGSNTISLIDLTTNTLTQTISVGTAPTGVAVNIERNVAVVDNNGSDNLSVVNLATGAVTTISGVGSKPFALGLNPLTGLGLVVNQSTNSASVIDLGTNTVTGTVTIGTGTNPAVAIEPRLNWAIVTPGGAGTLSVVDLGRRSVVATVNLGTGVRGIAINPETEQALLTEPTAASVLLFSLLDQTVIPLTLENDHVAADVNPPTSIGVTVNSTTGLASVLDLGTPVRLATISVGTTPRAVAIDPGSNTAVVANEGSNDVSILSLGAIRSPHLTQINPPTTFTSSTDLTLNVTGYGFVSGSVVRVDETPVSTTVVSARRLVATIPAAMLAGARRYAVDVENPGPVHSNVVDFSVIQAVPVGTAPRAVALDAERDLAVVTNTGSNNMSVVSLTTGILTTGSVTATIAVGTNPQGVAVLSRLRKAVVTNRGDNNASIVDLVGGTVTSTVTLGSEPIGVAINPDTAMAVVANSASNTISVFSADTGGTATSVAVNQGPVAVAVDPSRNLAAVAHATDNNVALVDLGLSMTKGRVLGFQMPTGVVFDPVSDRFLALSSLSNNFAIINPDTLQVSFVRIGINPTSLAYNFNTGTLVSVNSASQTVSVMDFLDRRVRAVLAIAGSQQFAVEIHPRWNLAVVVDESNNRVLLVPLPR